MRHSAKILIRIGVALIVAPIALAVLIAVWVYSALPENINPPEVLLSEAALQVFWVELGGPIGNQPELPKSFTFPGNEPRSRLEHASETLAQQAAKFVMFRHSRRPRPFRYMFAEILAQDIISKRWSAPEALTEFAKGSYYGHGYNGITEAATGFFARPVTELSTKELAMLAAITHSPASYSPWCKPEQLEKRMSYLRPALGFSSGLPNLRPAPPGACAKPGAA